MTDALAVAALGFFLGMRHATDADHVIAVTTIVARQRSMTGAAWIGAVWGVGHTLTILAVGGAIILWRWVIPPHIGLSMELSVGLMLIALGVMNLAGVWRSIRSSVAATPAHPDDARSPGPRPHDAATELVHSHAHAHGDYVHTHPHAHDPEQHPHEPTRTPLTWLDRRLGGLAPYQLARPLIVGIVHGLAGSAAVALLVLATITSTTWAVLYLLIFGLGTIAGMIIITALVSVPFTLTGGRLGQWNRGLRVASGAISLAFGLFIAYQIGMVDGLFTGHYHWTPR